MALLKGNVRRNRHFLIRNYLLQLPSEPVPLLSFIFEARGSLPRTVGDHTSVQRSLRTTLPETLTYKVGVCFVLDVAVAQAPDAINRPIPQLESATELIGRSVSAGPSFHSASLLWPLSISPIHLMRPATSPIRCVLSPKDGKRS